MRILPVINLTDRKKKIGLPQEQTTCSQKIQGTGWKRLLVVELKLAVSVAITATQFKDGNISKIRISICCDLEFTYMAK
jgi:hypothetical protein